MKTNNLFLEKISTLKELKEERKKIYSDFKETSKKLEGFDKKIKNIYKLCTHKHIDGTSALEYVGQDSGSGRSEHKCDICGYRD